MDNYFDSSAMLRLLIKWKWHLLVVAILAIITGLIFSVFILKPRYKSTAYLYPSNVLPYSDENETEQMIQWLTSRQVQDSVINKHHLAEHWGVNANDPHYGSLIDYLYNKFVKISKTQYESVEIAVSDGDPVLAKDIVNSIIFYTDIKIRLTHRKKYDEVLETWNRVMADKQTLLDSLKQRYSNLALNRINIPKNAQGAAVQSEGISAEANSLQNKGELIFMKSLLKTLGKEYITILEKYDLAKFDVYKEFTFINVVTPPQVPDKKSFPKPGMIILYFLVSSLAMSFLVIWVVENRKKIQNKVYPTNS